MPKTTAGKKKYRVRLEFRQRETIDVEATDRVEAEQLALEQVETTNNSEHYDTKIEEQP